MDNGAKSPTTMTLGPQNTYTLSGMLATETANPAALKIKK